jgi:hypothetical protein
MQELTSIRGVLQASYERTDNHYPDIAFIKKFVPIREIAIELELDVSGNSARCWRPDSHKNGDRTPSISFDTRKNIGRCFVCDSRAWSGIDLVMMVRGVSIREAAEWIAARFRVPQIRRRKHIKPREQWDSSSRVGVSGFALEEVVLTGFWATLTCSEIRILGVFCTFCPPGSGAKAISYRGIMRFAGVRSQSTVSRVLKCFSRMGLLEITRGSAHGFRVCNTYSLTLESSLLRDLLRVVYQRHTKEIEVERQIRTELRAARKGHPIHR